MSEMVARQNGTRPATRKSTRRPAASVPEPVGDSPAGFRRKPKIITLEFIGEWEGMRVSVRPMTYGEALDRNTTLDWNQPDTPRDEFFAGLRRTSEALASVLVSWNVLDADSRPVPATLDGLLSLDSDQAMAIVLNWAVRAIGVSVPLDRPSGSGGTSPELSIPMETLSPNPSN